MAPVTPPKKDTTKKPPILERLTRIPFVQKVFFVDHLRTMMHASLSLVESLSILEKEMSNKRFKRIVGEIKADVEKGQELSEVLSEYPKVFPPIYVKMVHAGEVSGKLDESLEQIVIQMKKTQALNSSIRGAMIYPAVILTAMGGVGVFMAFFVLPKLIDIFKEFDAELPLPTRILIGIVNAASNPWYVIGFLIIVIGSISGFVYALKAAPAFRTAVHRLNLRLPIAGPVIREINLARFSLTLSSLLKSTIPIIDAVDITADTCTNVEYRTALHQTATDIKSGKPLSELLARSPQLFPPIVTEMILVGERTGEVDHLLNELSGFYSDEVDKTMKNFTTIIEPVIIIVLGVAVAGVAVSIVLPMYTLVQNF